MDRNLNFMLSLLTCNKSLSARRAWIEIIRHRLDYKSLSKSLSARRAWIEILALDQYLNEQEGRSPQGERG